MPKPKTAPVDDYPERPFDKAKADPEDITAVEDRQPDQIADYHKTHPTLTVVMPDVKSEDKTPPKKPDGDSPSSNPDQA